MNAQAPRRLGGRYQVGELLGYGGMAEVHRGRDLRLGRDVAIKMLRTDLARDQTFQMRFRREAQNAAALNHPAIVAVYDTGEDRAPTGEVLPYIVMEFVAGRTLKEVLAAEGRIMPRRALEMTADICAALEFSHRHGIIHRDIKPGNVMLTPNGQVKVMDFGIARALASGATTMTQTSAVIGTAQYLSPEQARGEAVDARSDVYAAGCVLYELICGRPPFVGDSPVAVAYQHVREDPRPPSELNRDVTPSIDAIVLKALAKNPLNRYQSAGEMRADLLRAVAGQPVLATPVLRHDETTQMLNNPRGAAARGNVARAGAARRRRTSGWVVAALSVLGVLALVSMVVGLVMANQPEQVEVPDLLGLTSQQAEKLLADSKLRPIYGEPVFSKSCTKDTIAGQDPGKGETVEENSPITLSICNGEPMVEVPKLVTFNRPAATQRLEDLKLKYKFVEKDSEKPKDVVLSTDPPAGTSVPEGSTITVVISKGNLVKVPNVVGKSEDEARFILQQAGFKVEVLTGSSVTDPDRVGKVDDQEPGGNTLKERNSTIKIFVSVASEPSPQPSESPSASPTP